MCCANAIGTGCDYVVIARNVAELDEWEAGILVVFAVSGGIAAFAVDATVVAIVFAIADFGSAGINEFVIIIGIAHLAEVAFIQVLFFGFFKKSVAIEVETVANLIFAPATTLFFCGDDASASLETIII